MRALLYFERMVEGSLKRDLNMEELKGKINFDN